MENWRNYGKSMENDGKTLVLDVLGVLKRIGHHFSDLEVLPKYEDSQDTIKGRRLGVVN